MSNRCRPRQDTEDVLSNSTYNVIDITLSLNMIILGHDVPIATSLKHEFYERQEKDEGETDDRVLLATWKPVSSSLKYSEAKNVKKNKI